MSKLKSLDELFAGRHFDRDVIILCVLRAQRRKLSPPQGRRQTECTAASIKR
ncbi:hypothetical protein V4C53_42190 [Paraburkholderia azotifigens]